MNPAEITDLRFHSPGRITSAMDARPRFNGLASLPPGAQLLVVAADHPARGALAVGGNPRAMTDRIDLLDRIAAALARPGVHGFLGTADIVEELTLRGALDGKLVLGSMNRGGLAGASYALDDRFTAYDAPGILSAGLDGGKMLLRIDPQDPGSVATMQACAHAVNALAERGLIAMIEPFLCHRDSGGELCNDLSPDAVIRSIAIASGVGTTSAYTWLKLPVVAEMERVMAATTLPSLVLGGDASDDPDTLLERWRRAVALPSVRGLVAGRALLYPPDDDVAGAVDAAAGLLRAGTATSNPRLPPHADLAGQ